jgi:hypothetical protein
MMTANSVLCMVTKPNTVGWPLKTQAGLVPPPVAFSLPHIAKCKQLPAPRWMRRHTSLDSPAVRQLSQYLPVPENGLFGGCVTANAERRGREHRSDSA